MTNFWTRDKNIPIDVYHPNVAIDAVVWLHNSMFTKLEPVPVGKSTNIYRIIGKDGPVGASNKQREWRNMLWKMSLGREDGQAVVPEYLMGFYSPGADLKSKAWIVNYLTQPNALDVSLRDGFEMSRFELHTETGEKICDIHTHALGRTTCSHVSFFNRYNYVWDKGGGEVTDRSGFKWSDEDRGRYEKVFKDLMHGVGWRNPELVEEQFRNWFDVLDKAIENYEWKKEAEDVTLKVMNMKNRVEEWKKEGRLCSESEMAFMSMSSMLGAPSTPKIARKYLGFFDQLLNRKSAQPEANPC